MDEDKNSLLSYLIEEHGKSVFAAAYRILGNTEDAEEVLQDTFFKKIQNPIVTMCLSLGNKIIARLAKPKNLILICVF